MSSAAGENSTNSRPDSKISLWIKVPFTAWVAVLVPVWVVAHGWENFLWLSDVALLGTLVALWLESRLLASMMAVGIVVPDGAWSVHFLGQLVVDAGPLERGGDMFDESVPLPVRGLSLYHLFLPPVLLWMIHRLGYDRRAVVLQTLLAWTVLVATYLVTAPSKNINLVYGFGDPPEPPLPQPWWLAAYAVLLAVCVHLPTHALLERWKGRRGEEHEDEETRISAE